MNPQKATIDQKSIPKVFIMVILILTKFFGFNIYIPLLQLCANCFKLLIFSCMFGVLKFNYSLFWNFRFLFGKLPGR